MAELSTGFWDRNSYSYYEMHNYFDNFCEEQGDVRFLNALCIYIADPVWIDRSISKLDREYLISLGKYLERNK